MGNYSPRMVSLQSLINRENMFNYLDNYKKDSQFLYFDHVIVLISDSISCQKRTQKIRKCMSRFDMRINKVVT